MKFSEFKRIAKKKGVLKLIDLDSLEQVKEGQKILVKDNRTQQNEDGHFLVKPIAMTETQMFVVCPVCGEVHVHGLEKEAKVEEGCILPSDNFCGHRVSHCKGLRTVYQIYLIIA